MTRPVGRKFISISTCFQRSMRFPSTRTEDKDLGPNCICPSYHSAYHTRALDAHMLRARARVTSIHDTQTSLSWRVSASMVHVAECSEVHTLSY